MNWPKLSIAVLIALLLGLVYFLYPSTITNPEYALYASIAEGYLGFFSLTFSILFVLIQLLPYSDLDLTNSVFDIGSILYFVLLLAVISLALFVLAFELDSLAVRIITLIFAIVTFILFPPLFLHLRSKLRPSNIIDHIVQNFRKKTMQRRVDDLEEHIDFLFRITTKAYTLHDYVTVQHALKTFGKLFNVLQSYSEEGLYPTIVSYLLQRISDLRRIFLGDIYAVKLILDTLFEIGQQTIQKGLPNSDIGKIMEIIELIPWQAVNTKNSLALQEAIRTYNHLLIYMSDTLYNQDFQSKLAKWYVLIGAYGLQNSDEYCQRIVILSLKDHVIRNRIKYDVACEQALNTVQSNEYWELKKENVSKFIKKWTQTALLKSNPLRLAENSTPKK